MKEIEQINSSMNIEISDDIILSKYLIRQIFQEIFEKINCQFEYLNNKNKSPIIIIHETKKYLLLYAQVTYLGNPHPKYKKRIQIPSRWLDYYQEYGTEYIVKFIGLYFYKGNTIIIDFDPSLYINKKLNNSSAHVYINDLYQAMKNKIFRKKDRFNNIITCVRKIYFAEYLFFNKIKSHELIQILDDFNHQFPFYQDIYGVDAYKNMHDNKFSNALQAEWAGFFLEYKFKEFLKNNNFNNLLVYVQNKNKNTLDFDLWSPKYQFFSDLKSSDECSRAIILNDKLNIINAIEMYGKLWIILYEHSTIKDYELEYQTTRFWNRLLNKFNDMSYAKRMKGVINYKNMIVIEINRVNYRDILDDFNQGKNSNGNDRNIKYSLKKLKLNDNFIVYRY